MEALADEFSLRIESNAMERCWIFWKKASQIKAVEKIVLERVGLRVIGDVLDVWKKRM